jgi:hypothetical protein
MNLISRKMIQIPFQLNDDCEAIKELMKRYQNVPIINSPYEEPQEFCMKKLQLKSPLNKQSPRRRTNRV